MRTPGRCLLALLLCSTGWASAADDPDPLFFWQVRGSSDAEATVYLLGAVAVPNTIFLRPDPVIRAAYEGADRVVLPTDAVQGKPMERAALMREKGRLPDGQTLDQLVSADLHADLVSRLALGSIPARRVAQVVPWFTALLVYGADLQRNEYVDETEFYHYFDGLARGFKEVRTLSDEREIYDRQNARPLELQVLQIELALARSRRADESLPAIYAAWQAGDVAAMEPHLFGVLEDRPKLEALVEETTFVENARFVADVEALLEDGGTSFLVLPARHLVGAHGVLARLEKRGHDVEQQRKAGR